VLPEELAAFPGREVRAALLPCQQRDAGNEHSKQAFGRHSECSSGSGAESGVEQVLIALDASGSIDVGEGDHQPSNAACSFKRAPAGAR